MRAVAILSIVAAVLGSIATANAEQKAKGAAAKGQDRGAMLDKCRAEAYGYGSSKAAQVRACMQRARGH
jgi:hypothetical protein